MMKPLLSFSAALGIVLASAARRAEATEYIFTLIDYPGATHTYAYGINDSGQIVGAYYVGGLSHGFTWSGGVYTSFDYPGAASGGSGAYGINNSGQIVGWYDRPGAETYGAYLRDGDGYQALTPFGSDWSEAFGINDAASVVGRYQDATDVYRGFLFDGTSYTTLDDPGAVHTYAEGINDAGVIVGQGRDSAFIPTGAWVRDASGNFTHFYVDGFLAATATGINDAGQIVGAYGPGFDEHWGFVLTGGVDGTSDRLVPPGAPITDALDINNLGQVVGGYTNGTFANGPWRGFLATPIAAADFDMDGDVDGADLTMWRGAFGLNAEGDADDDGDTDGADFLVWQRQLSGGARVGATSSAAPEPASLCLVLMALAVSVRAARNTL
jgi:uncharacterized membrane protein